MHGSIASRPLTFERTATGVFFLAVMAAACLMPAQTDTWWQLRTGEEMWRSQQVMLRDEFTHTVHGRYWPNHEWLAQIIFYVAHRIGGLPLLTALCAAAVTLAWAIVARLTPGVLLPRIALLGAGVILTSPSWSLRPQVFSIAFFAVTMWIIASRRWLWTLPLLFVIWANLHGAVALGGVLVAAAFAATLLCNRDQWRTMAAMGAACLLATAATPLGFSLWQEIPASVARLRSYGVIEWQSPGLSIVDAPFWIAAAAVAVLLVHNRARLRTSWNVAFLGTATLMFLPLALQTRRNILPFLMCAVPLIGTLLPHRFRVAAVRRVERPRLNRMILTTTALAGVLVVSSAWSEPIPRLGWKPVASELQVAVERCPGHLYNTYDDGGYLIWFVRDRKVFMDSRQDPFPADMVRDHIVLETTGEYTNVFARYSIGCALTTQGSPLASRLARDGWELRSAGGPRAVFSRPAGSALLNRSERSAGSQ